MASAGVFDPVVLAVPDPVGVGVDEPGVGDVLTDVDDRAPGRRRRASTSSRVPTAVTVPSSMSRASAMGGSSIVTIRPTMTRLPGPGRRAGGRARRRGARGRRRRIQWRAARSCCRERGNARSTTSQRSGASCDDAPPVARAIMAAAPAIGRDGSLRAAPVDRARTGRPDGPRRTSAPGTQGSMTSDVDDRVQLRRWSAADGVSGRPSYASMIEPCRRRRPRSIQSSVDLPGSCAVDAAVGSNGDVPSSQSTSLVVSIGRTRRRSARGE